MDYSARLSNDPKLNRLDVGWYQSRKAPKWNLHPRGFCERKSDKSVEKEYIVFCDESDRSGSKYSDFYGGLVVRGSQIQRIEAKLHALISQLGLKEEIKWSKVNELYLKSYTALLSQFFDEVRLGNIKVRIMFHQNRYQPKGLTKEQREQSYFLLYYQFIKHGFGFVSLAEGAHPVRLRLYFDQLPDTREKCERFKAFVIQLFENNKDYRGKQLTVKREDITEVRSHDHVLLQCLDVVLGSMSFRLNDKHKIKPEGSLRRGKRTRAKEQLYKAILSEIRTMNKNFNIGITTGRGEDRSNWSLAYAHWSFIPKSHELK